MALPERLRAWMREESGWNQRIIVALMEGVAAGVKGEPLAKRTKALRYAARTAEGDAFEEGWFFGEDRR